MNFNVFGNKNAPTLMLIPGLGVSYEIFIPLINLLENDFQIIAVEVDGFVVGKHTHFTSVDEQAVQIIDYIKKLDMSLFVYDYDYNAPTPEHLEATHEPFFKIIRAKQPDLPIIMITRPSTFRTGAEETAKAYAVIRATYDNAKASGDENVYFINGLEFFPEDDSEYLVEGTHPNNLGYSLIPAMQLNRHQRDEIVRQHNIIACIPFVDCGNIYPIPL